MYAAGNNHNENISVRQLKKNRIFRICLTQKPFINYRFSNHMVQLTLIYMYLDHYGATTQCYTSVNPFLRILKFLHLNSNMRIFEGMKQIVNHTLCYVPHSVPIANISFKNPLQNSTRR